MPPSLKIGVIVDGEHVTKYVHDIVQWAGQQDDLHISHLIIQDTVNGARSGRASRSILQRSQWLRPADFVAAMLRWCIDRIETYRLRDRPRLLQGARLHEIGRLVADRIHVRPIVSASGFVHRFAEEDLEAIRREGFDLLIRGGGGILRGAILEVARLGILSFHHGDNRRYRGGPPGFWEILRGDPRTGFSLQVLTEELDGGPILARGNFPTQDSWLANRLLLQARSNGFLQRTLKEIARTGRLPSAQASTPYSAPLYRAPGPLALARFLATHLNRSTLNFLRRLAGIEDRWNVAYAHGNWRDAVLWRGKRIPNPKGRFLADPFVIERDGGVFCFVEDYSYATGLGKISVHQILESGSREIGIALEERFHLSFPYLFTYGGNLYMCPETGGAGEIRIYRCQSFPLGWELAAVPMKDVVASDSMLFESGGRWWMLTNLDSSGVGDRCSELHLFSAENPLAPAWTAHPGNPLVVDSVGARNGGLIREGDAIFRVAQVHGGGREYGRSSQVYQIVHLDGEHYEERLICELKPDFGIGIVGTHHLHSDGRTCVWDFKTRERPD